MASKAMHTKAEIGLLAAWRTAQRMVRESQSPTASPWERTRLAKRTEWAAQVGAECLKAGLLEVM